MVQHGPRGANLIGRLFRGEIALEGFDRLAGQALQPEQSIVEQCLTRFPVGNLEGLPLHPLAKRGRGYADSGSSLLNRGSGQQAGDRRLHLPCQLLAVSGHLAFSGLRRFSVYSGFPADGTVWGTARRGAEVPASMDN